MGAEPDYRPFEVVEKDERTILRVHGTKKQRVKVEADKVHIIMDAIAQGWDIDIGYADIEGGLYIWMTDKELEQTEGDRLVIKGNIMMFGCNISGNADFRSAHFNGYASFAYAHFSGDVDFAYAHFSMGACFWHAHFRGFADFGSAHFSRGADFGSAHFSRGANFWSAHFSGEAGFLSAKFSSADFGGDASFGSADFGGDVSFWSAQFAKGAGFGFTRFSGNAVFGSAHFSRGAIFDGSMFTEEANLDQTLFEGKADFSNARFLRDLYLSLANFGESSSLSLENSVYPNIYVNLPNDPNRVSEFLNNPSEDTYLRLLKNQRDLGRPYKSLYVAMQRDRRAQKFPLVRWIEWFLFDFPTKYGTASFPPKGMLIYIAVVLVVFTGSYCGINAHLQRSRDVEILEYDKTDGGKVNIQRKPGTMDIFWFSLNTFIPAVKFVNVQHWRIRDDVVLKIIRCSTLATFESILGWLLVPILLRYFRL